MTEYDYIEALGGGSFLNMPCTMNQNMEVEFKFMTTGSYDVFEADKYEVDFGYAGGTDTITVTAENSWSCTTPTGFSLSPTSGSPGDTTVTVTAGRSGTEKAGTATFTDSNSNTFDVELTQSGDGALFPFAKIIRGTRRIN